MAQQDPEDTPPKGIAARRQRDTDYDHDGHHVARAVTIVMREDARDERAATKIIRDRADENHVTVSDVAQAIVDLTADPTPRRDELPGGVR